MSNSSHDSSRNLRHTAPQSTNRNFFKRLGYSTHTLYAPRLLTQLDKLAQSNRGLIAARPKGACKPPHALPRMPHAVRTPTNGVRTAGSACGPAGQACWPCTPVRPGSRKPLKSRGLRYRGSRKPLKSRGLREPTGVQSLHACPKGVQALHALQTGVQALHACTPGVQRLHAILLGVRIGVRTPEGHAAIKPLVLDYCVLAQ
ncbi:hypothetical protein PCASD_04045 [Puccinia coronata f. sp. avenae]|uniref:Uncharacterized protein n=1 Tax=Puccinia coronata f. sp. avenae TaxID=200324 RepID=A0A2N5VCJ9_9BASI|nr:hypothetical protein PCASD_04045 [Puccinia coronata f. sp. avenae]